MIEEICPRKYCTGCMACLSSCAHSAIEITKDELGFHYPMINTDICIGCGVCHNVCPVNSPVHKVFPSQCFAVAEESIDRLAHVASGGAATAISSFILSKGGIVFGCSGEDIRNVRHIRIDKESDLCLLRGSRYVQSEIGCLFRDVRSQVLTGKSVLFIGTPCQVGGLRNFLHKDYDNLFTIDLVCHGVPSQQILNENIDYYKKRYSDLVEGSIAFRQKKSIASSAPCIRYGFFFYPSPGSTLKEIEWYNDPFMLGFLGCATFRLSCYECDYSYNVRASDLTLSDFWGLGKDAGFVNGRGVSSLLVNTAKGQALWSDFQSSAKGLKILRRKIRESISNNGQLMCPTVKYPCVDEFRVAYPKYGFVKAIEKALWKKQIKGRMSKFISVFKSIVI